MNNKTVIVVDSNMLNSPELLAYFSDSRNNKIVLPDYIAMEAYKGNRADSMIASMETVMRFPDQTMILNGTGIVSRMKDTADQLKWSFINKEHTKLFSEFCHQLQLAKRGHPGFQSMVSGHTSVANKQMNSLLAQAELLPPLFKEMEGVFDEKERKIIRKLQPMTSLMLNKVYHIAENMANEGYFNHPGHKRKPRSGVNKHHFIFRYAVAATLLSLKWISRSNARKVKPERLRNDLVDTTLVTYSTYYDGLMTSDKDTIWLENNTMGFLNLVR